ncbi:MAG: class I SAM-dependent methyltransferase [Spirochaetes bacterium]|nr:class I SAM-dependent methyltransferase [Spirochaetota bacterium]
MTIERHIRLFDIIAPVYGLFFKYQRRMFPQTLDVLAAHVSMKPETAVLDIGCGTGALTSVLHERGLAVTGADASASMLRQAKHHTKNAIPFHLVRPGEALPFADKTFSLVVSSFVAHGLTAPHRAGLYREAKRLAKDAVVFIDYGKKRNIGASIIEFFEGGDYFNFRDNAESEMRAHFSSVSVIPLRGLTVLYICR